MDGGSRHNLQTTATRPTGPYEPYRCTRHYISRSRYITKSHPNGSISVYEYSVNSESVMMDADDGYILWSGIWKALGYAKIDVVKVLARHNLTTFRRLQGGYLKTQGIWIPYESALHLSRRVAWPIREDLIPLFGPTFPTTCFSPTSPEYGIVHIGGLPQCTATSSRKRRSESTSSCTEFPAIPVVERWPTPSPHVQSSLPSLDTRTNADPLFHNFRLDRPRSSPTFSPVVPSQVVSQMPYVVHRTPPHEGESLMLQRLSTTPKPARFSPYGPKPLSPQCNSRGFELPPLNSLQLDSPSPHPFSLSHPHPNNIRLPPIHTIADGVRFEKPVTGPLYTLPPISSLDDLSHPDNPIATLRRLTLGDGV